MKGPVAANQRPDLKNFFSRNMRRLLSNMPLLGLIPGPDNRPQGISVMMRVKNEADWIRPSVESIRDIADEIIIVDNGSTDGTYEVLTKMAMLEKGLVKVWSRPELDHCSLSNFALGQTSFRWVFRWDGDMVAHTTGRYTVSHLRERIMRLDQRRYYIIYLRHINLAGDLLHQDPKEMVHIEEYIHTNSDKTRYVHPGRFEAVRFPKYYQPLFWYEPYSFHVNVKPARRMLLRRYWEGWMELKDYRSFPALEDYVDERIKLEFGTQSWEKAQNICLERLFRDYIPYDPDRFGPYPDVLQPYLEKGGYRLKYEDGIITGREEL